MPMYDYKYLLCAAATVKNGEYTTDEINFGNAAPNPGGTGRFGLHVVVTTVIAGAASGLEIWVFHSAATTPTTKHVGRWFATASLAAGTHFFVPIPATCLQYVRAGVICTSEDVSSGAFTMWLGPDEDGAL